MKQSQLKKNLTWTIAQHIVQDSLLNGKNLFDIKEKEKWDTAKNNIDKISKILNKKLTYKESVSIFNAGFKTI